MGHHVLVVANVAALAFLLWPYIPNPNRFPQQGLWFPAAESKVSGVGPTVAFHEGGCELEAYTPHRNVYWCTYSMQGKVASVTGTRIHDGEQRVVSFKATLAQASDNLVVTEFKASNPKDGANIPESFKWIKSFRR